MTDPALIHVTGADNQVARSDADQVAGVVVLARTGERAYFTERPLVQEGLDALTGGPPPSRVMFGYRLGATELRRESATSREFVQLGVPLPVQVPQLGWRQSSGLALPEADCLTWPIG